MRAAAWTGMILVAIILQSTIMPLLAVKGIRPDLVLVVVVSSGLLLGKNQSVGIGFFSGLLQDLASGNIFGLNILSKMAIGYVAGMAEQQVFKENILLPIIAVSLATVVNSVLVMILLILFGHQVEVLSMLISGILPLLAYNILISIPVHQAIYRLKQALE